MLKTSQILVVTFKDVNRSQNLYETLSDDLEAVKVQEEPQAESQEETILQVAQPRGHRRILVLILLMIWNERLLPD